MQQEKCKQFIEKKIQIVFDWVSFTEKDDIPYSMTHIVVYVKIWDSQGSLKWFSACLCTVVLFHELLILFPLLRHSWVTLKYFCYVPYFLQCINTHTHMNIIRKNTDALLKAECNMNQNNITFLKALKLNTLQRSIWHSLKVLTFVDSYGI